MIKNIYIQPNILKPSSIWKEMEIQSIADSLWLPIELLYNSSTSWRQTCNSEVKSAVSELYSEDKTAVKIWVQTQLFPFPIFPRNFSDPALDIFMPFESTFKQNHCLEFYFFFFFYKLLYK